MDEEHKKARHRELNREWARANRGKIREWRAENPERVAEYNRRWRETNKSRIKEQNARWEMENPGKREEVYKNWRHKTLTGRASRILTTIRSNAKRRGHPAPAITKEWILEKLRAGLCEVSGIPFDFQLRGPWSPSVDQISPGRGYTEENARMVCFIFNLAKNKFADDDVMTLARALINHIDNRKEYTK